MRFRYIAFAALILNIAIVWLNAAPMPALDLDKLTENANLIVEGEVAAIRDEAKIQLCIIQVKHLIKGPEHSDTIGVRFLASELRVAWGPIRERRYGVFFLKPTPSGSFEFADLYYPFVPTFKGDSPNGGTPIDRVVYALSNPLRSTASTPSQKMTAIFIVSRSKSPASTTALRSAMKDPSPKVQLSAAGALLERNDVTGVSFAVDALSHGSPDTSLPVYHNVLYAISEGLKNPDAIPALKALLSSGNPEVRRAAASALVHTHSPDAIDPLLTSLKDSDFQTQYYSAVGLAEISGQMDWRPNEDNFRADRLKYLEHWREWASNR